MNQQILLNSNNTNTSSYARLSILELVQEMKLLGVDPKPLLEIAAIDLFSQYGTKAISYIELMLDQMIEDDNPDGLYLWKELYCILNDLVSTPQATIH